MDVNQWLKFEIHVDDKQELACWIGRSLLEQPGKSTFPAW